MKKSSEGVVVHDGISFDKAVADIKVGNRIRPVGVFGDSKDVGLIDLTDAVERGEDGHPKFASMVKETKSILADFFSILRES